VAKTIETQEGEVTLASPGDTPTEAAPETPEYPDNVAYSSVLDGILAKEEAARKAAEPVDIFRTEDWSELPNFSCPACPFSTLDGDAAVLAHGAFRHPGVNLKEMLTNG
jgi:hypothetical protein